MSSSLANGQNELRLQRENDALRREVETLRRNYERQVSLKPALEGSRRNVTLLPRAMKEKFGNVDYPIRVFSAELARLLDDPSHRESVVRAMKSTRKAMAFRAALTNDRELRELAMQPLATEHQVWTAFIWRFLVRKVFSWDGVREFYSWEDESAWDGQNAGYYIQNIDEIDELMQREDESPADEFARQTWRKQAIDAVFPTDGDNGGTKNSTAPRFSTKDHPWLASNREAKIEQLTINLRRAFAVFSNPHPHALDRMREIISHAVRLNEYMMHETEVTYTVDMENTTVSYDEFYNNRRNMEMTAVNTDSGRRVRVDSAMKDMLQSDIRSRFYKVCTIQPALRSTTWQDRGPFLERGPVVTEVRSRVAVGWALNRNNLPDKESMFHIMAQSLGFYTKRNTAQPV